MEAVNSSLVVKDNKFIENLRNWYINNANNLDKAHAIQTKAENTAGGIAVSIFAPYLLPIVPAVQKGYKEIKKKIHEAIDTLVRDKLNVSKEETKDKPTLKILDELSDDKVEEIVSSVANNIIEEKGMQRK